MSMRRLLGHLPGSRPSSTMLLQDHHQDNRRSMSMRRLRGHPLDSRRSNNSPLLLGLLRDAHHSRSMHHPRDHLLDSPHNSIMLLPRVPRQARTIGSSLHPALRLLPRSSPSMIGR